MMIGVLGCFFRVDDDSFAGVFLAGGVDFRLTDGVIASTCAISSWTGDLTATDSADTLVMVHCPRGFWAGDCRNGGGSPITGVITGIHCSGCPGSINGYITGGNIGGAFGGDMIVASVLCLFLGGLEIGVISM